MKLLLAFITVLSLSIAGSSVCRATSVELDWLHGTVTAFNEGYLVGGWTKEGRAGVYHVHWYDKTLSESHAYQYTSEDGIYAATRAFAAGDRVEVRVKKGLQAEYTMILLDAQLKELEVVFYDKQEAKARGRVEQSEYMTASSGWMGQLRTSGGKQVLAYQFDDDHVFEYHEEAEDNSNESVIVCTTKSTGTRDFRYVLKGSSEAEEVLFGNLTRDNETGNIAIVGNYRTAGKSRHFDYEGTFFITLDATGRELSRKNTVYTEVSEALRASKKSRQAMRADHLYAVGKNTFVAVVSLHELMVISGDGKNLPIHYLLGWETIVFDSGGNLLDKRFDPRADWITDTWETYLPFSEEPYYMVGQQNENEFVTGYLEKETGTVVSYYSVLSQKSHTGEVFRMRVSASDQSVRTVCKVPEGAVYFMLPGGPIVAFQREHDRFTLKTY